MEYLIAYFVVSIIVFGYLGFWVAVECGRGRLEGFVLGALFGPLGVIVVGLLPKFPYEKAVREARQRPSRDEPVHIVDEQAIQDWLQNH